MKNFSVYSVQTRKAHIAEEAGEIFRRYWSYRTHGVIFAAACDFSKKAGDAFRLKLQQKGIQEFHLGVELN